MYRISYKKILAGLPGGQNTLKKIKDLLRENKLAFFQSFLADHGHSIGGYSNLERSVKWRTIETMLSFLRHTYFALRSKEDHKVTLSNLVMEDMIQANYKDKELVLRLLEPYKQAFLFSRKALKDDPKALVILSEADLNLKLDLVESVLILLNSIHKFETEKGQVNDLGLTQAELLDFLKQITCEEFVEKTLSLLREVHTQDSERIVYLVGHYVDHILGNHIGCLLHPEQDATALKLHIHVKFWANGNIELLRRLAEEEGSSILSYLVADQKEEFRGLVRAKIEEALALPDNKPQDVAAKTWVFDLWSRTENVAELTEKKRHMFERTLVRLYRETKKAFLDFQKHSGPLNATKRAQWEMMFEGVLGKIKEIAVLRFGTSFDTIFQKIVLEELDNCGPSFKQGLSKAEGQRKDFCRWLFTPTREELAYRKNESYLEIFASRAPYDWEALSLLNQYQVFQRKKLESK